MSEPFLAEIRILPYTFAPRNWAFCSGGTMIIAQNQALYSLLGNMYGGNGTTTFLLPDLRGRAPMHFGQGPGLSPRTQGISGAGGTETVTLTANQIPSHTHTARATTNAATTNVPTGNILADSGPAIYATPNAPVGMINAPTGGGQPHENRMPYLVINFCIALQGVFPPRN